MADPGFLRQGMSIQDGGANLLPGQFSPRLHENEKKNCPRGGRSCPFRYVWTETYDIDKLRWSILQRLCLWTLHHFSGKGITYEFLLATDVILFLYYVNRVAKHLFWFGLLILHHVLAYRYKNLMPLSVRQNKIHACVNLLFARKVPNWEWRSNSCIVSKCWIEWSEKTSEFFQKQVRQTNHCQYRTME